MRYCVITCTLDSVGRQLAVIDGRSITMPNWIKGKTATLCFVLQTMDLTKIDVVILKDDDIRTFAYNESMAAVFYDPRVGVACGNRRFENVSTIASATRHVWGEFAKPIMDLIPIPCGAFMGIRVQLIPAFIEFWKTSVFDDTAAAEIAKAYGMEFRYVRKLENMIDNSSISWKLYWEFVVRQYADVRCIGPWEKLTTVWIFALMATVAAWTIMGWAAPALYLSALIFPIKKTWRVMLALPIAQLSFLIGVPVAAFSKTIKWKHRTVDLRRNEFVQHTDDK